MTVEPKVFDHVKKILASFDGKYMNGDVLRRNAIIEDLDKYDERLMEALLSDKLIHDTYTKKIAGVELFEVNQFISMLEFKEYWEDSYTKYSNKIGLTAGGKFIDENEDVVLDFPYKDCVLKGGMTKEEIEHAGDADEPFLNEVIAKPEIDEMLEPKVFVNAKKYDKDGVHVADSIEDGDNLIVKGNNLIALYSLKERYAGKVKLIYLDPPYNTGNDSYLYNDNFNHSSWLTFMKNRLEIARDLLKDDGLIFVHIDYNEAAYLKVLMDNVMGQENYLSTICVKSNSISGTKTHHKNKTILKNKDSILVYVKDSNTDFKLNPQYTAKKEWDTHYNSYLENSGQQLKAVSLKDKLIKNGIISKDGRITKDSWNIPGFRKFVSNNSDKIFRLVNSIPEDLKKLSLQHKGEIVKKQTDTETLYAYNGSRLAMLNKTLQQINGEKIPAQLLGDLWTDIDFQNTQNQGGVSFTNAKKPEQLLKRIIDLGTNEGDLVLDFFMGSATTQAVAMKMHRQFIGIEQMYYINTVSVPRLQKVIEGEQGGISKDVDWQGGGSFVYAELMEKNKGYVKDVMSADSLSDLLKVFNRMKTSTDFDFRVDLEKFEQELHGFSNVDESKKELLRILDKNQLYYNYANIDDANVRDLISDSDYAFNKSLYKD